MSKYFPIDISANGFLIDELFWLAFILICVTFALVVAILLFFSLRYYSRPGRQALYTHGTSKKALGLTLTLAVIVFLVLDVNLAFHDHHAWNAIWGNPPDPAAATRVQIYPQQFAWNIRYAGPDNEFATEDDVVTLNSLHLPVNKPVLVQLKSKDVIHSFFLPNLRIKLDAIPGLVTMLYFEPRITGRYDIACAEHCGLGHYQMKGDLIVESEEEFASWLSDPSTPDKAEETGWGWDWDKTPAG